MSKIHKLELLTGELALIKAALSVFMIQMSQGSVDPNLSADVRRGCAKHYDEVEALYKKIKSL